jgi:hypothetical protein
VPNLQRQQRAPPASFPPSKFNPSFPASCFISVPRAKAAAQIGTAEGANHSLNVGCWMLTLRKVIPAPPRIASPIRPAPACFTLSCLRVSPLCLRVYPQLSPSTDEFAPSTAVRVRSAAALLPCFTCPVPSTASPVLVFRRPRAVFRPPVFVFRQARAVFRRACLCVSPPCLRAQIAFAEAHFPWNPPPPSRFRIPPRWAAAQVRHRSSQVP